MPLDTNDYHEEGTDYEKVREARYVYTCLCCGGTEDTTGLDKPTGWVEVQPSFDDVDDGDPEPIVTKRGYLCYNCITPEVRQWIDDLIEEAK